MFKKWIYGIVASFLVFTTLGAAVAPAFAKELNPNFVIIITKKAKVQKGQPLTITVGKKGIYMPLVTFDGIVKLDSVQLSSLPKPTNVLIWNGALNWTVTDANGKAILYNGIGPTVFFNLETGYWKRALTEHRAVIYHMTSKGGWEALSTFTTKGGSRAAAYTKGLGVYALAIKK